MKLYICYKLARKHHSNQNLRVAVEVDKVT